MLAFFGVAVVVGLGIRTFLVLRLRSAARRSAPYEEVCRLEQANRVTSLTLLASLAGLVVVGVVLAVASVR